MVIERVWAMPSRWTFSIKPIKRLLDSEMGSGMLINGLWCDPFAGKHSEAQVTNDQSDKIISGTSEDGLEFLKNQPSNHFDGVLYDPPYSITQAKKYGTKFANKAYWTACKKEIARITKSGGKVICFGWNSGGLGKNLGFTIERILLVPHGGNRNDTIVTVERKVR